MKKRIYYYSDEVNDDFSSVHVTRKQIDENFKYYKTGFWARVKKFLIYRVIVTPLVIIYTKILARVSYKNRKVTKGYKKGAAFIYGNHTGYANDAFSPTMIAMPRTADVVVSSDTTSINGLQGILMNIGAIPIPEDFHVMHKFNDALSHAINKRHWIAIYPEAHIWPYYTKIRPFPSVSFRYPVKYDVPVFSYTMTYKKRKISRRPKQVVYIDGPFFPDKTLPAGEAKNKLRDEVYEAMCKAAQNSNYCYADYVYRSKEDGGVGYEKVKISKKDKKK